MDDTTVTEAEQAQLDDDAAREELRAKIRLGIEQLDRGESIEVNEEFFERLRQRIAEKEASRR